MRTCPLAFTIPFQSKRPPFSSISTFACTRQMATKPAEEAPEQLKYKTWVLKVLIHCEGCKKNVKKLLQGIEGVYEVEVDSQQHKVTVTGNVEAETLQKKLLRFGKHSELWPENPSNKSKTKKKTNKSNKDNATPAAQEAGANKNIDDDYNEDDKKAPPQATKGNDHEGEESPEDEEEEEAIGEVPAPTGGKKKKNKKKNKGQNGNVGEVVSDSGSTPPNLAPPNMLPSQQVSPYAVQMFYPPQPPAYGLSYNTAYPSATASYYAAPMYDHYGSNYRYYPLPPPSDRIYLAGDRDHFDYRYDNYDSGCSVM